MTPLFDIFFKGETYILHTIETMATVMRHGCAPNVVNTFCQEYNWAGKRVYAFATSGRSGIGKTAEKLKPYVKGAISVSADLVNSADDLKK